MSVFDNGVPKHMFPDTSALSPWAHQELETAPYRL